MITFSIVKSAIIEKASRILKVQQYGAKTADQVSSFGDDSSPLKDMVAIYSKTGESGDNIILGYINKNQVAEPGEKRIFSLDGNGAVSFSIYLKKDGTCEIGEGAADNAVRYSALETSFNQLKTDFNNFVNSYNLHQHTVPNGASPPTTIATPTNADISPAKINEIKTL